MATATYNCIATTTLGSNTTTVTFDSISGSYTDLVLICQAAAVVTPFDLRARFNSDTGSNYSITYLAGTGSSALSNRYSNRTFAELDAYAFPDTTVGNSVHIVHIMNYSNSTTYKTYLARANQAPVDGVQATVGLWRSTSAITRIDLQFYGYTTDIKSGSSFSLFGIKAE